MRWQKNIRCKSVLKGIFLLAGVILFTAQLSGKFYWSASMPAAPLPAQATPVSVSAATTGALQHRLTGNNSHTAWLSLDKRYDLATVFDLPSPIIRATHYSAGEASCLLLQAGDLLHGIPVHTLLRGPPSHLD